MARRVERTQDEGRSRQRPPTWHRGTIATISGGSMLFLSFGGNREVQTILTSANRKPLGSRRHHDPTITFNDRDLRSGAPDHDEPMVISVVVAEYKIELVLVDQGSSANILY
ncbi:hypothetical protein CR513_55987, partial [Mucuna pruriens]